MLDGVGADSEPVNADNLGPFGFRSSLGEAFHSWDDMSGAGKFLRGSAVLWQELGQSDGNGEDHLVPGGQLRDGQTSVGYNCNTGEVFIDPPLGIQFTSFVILSESGIFTGAPAQNLGGPLDMEENNMIVKIASFDQQSPDSSFSSLSFGNIAATGLSDQFVLNDLSVRGSVLPSGGVGVVDLIYVCGREQPESLVSGDFNLDGRLDIVTANRISNDVTLQMGRGDGTFAEETFFPVDQRPFSIVKGHFNDDDGDSISGDGDFLDVATLNRDSISVLLGTGELSFDVQMRLPLDSSVPKSFVTGDFVGNDEMDLAVALVANDGSDASILVLEGQGDGTFLESHRSPAGDGISSLVVGRFNDDPHPDLAAINEKTGEIEILLGDGEGRFDLQPAISLDIGRAMSLVAGKFNDDNLLDLAATGESNNVAILLGTGAAMFRQTKPDAMLQAGNDPRSIIGADFDGDGASDLAIANSASGDVTVFLGRGDGMFARITDFRFAVGEMPRSLVAGNFNSDDDIGFLDVVTANAGSNDISVLLGNGNGTFGEANDDPSGATEILLGATVTEEIFWPGDVDHFIVVLDRSGELSVRVDPSGFVAKVEILDTDLSSLAEGGINTVRIVPRGDYFIKLSSDGPGTYTLSTELRPAALPVGDAPTSLVAGDFNNDNIPDLASANSGDDNVTVLLGIGDGIFVSDQDFRFDVGAEPRSIVAADVDGDDILELVTANRIGGTITILKGAGDGRFTLLSSIEVGFRPEALVAANFTNDSILDLATVHPDANEVRVLAGRAGGGFEGPEIIRVNGGPVALTVADFNSDGLMDLATANSSANDISVLLRNGNGSFQETIRVRVGNRPLSITTGDFNLDGRADLATANVGSDDVSVLIRKDDGMFASSRFTVGGSPTSIATGHFDDRNADGRISDEDFLDLVTTNFGSGDVSALRSVGDGTFRVQVRSSTLDNPSAAVTGNFDLDGRFDDLATANKEADSVIVLRGVGEGAFRSTVALSTSFPLDVALTFETNIMSTPVADSSVSVSAETDQAQFVESVTLGNSGAATGTSTASFVQAEQVDVAEIDAISMGELPVAPVEFIAAQAQLPELPELSTDLDEPSSIQDLRPAAEVPPPSELSESSIPGLSRILAGTVAAICFIVAALLTVFGGKFLLGNVTGHRPAGRKST